MECPYCGCELVQTDWYGYKVYGEHYWIPDHWEKTGDIFTCSHHEGFDTKEEVIEYMAEDENFQLEDWEGICCFSDTFNGNFYTDKNGNLEEGYPC